MTIVHVVNFFLPDHAAGTENYVNNIALLQQQKGHAVFVVRPDYWGREDYIYEGLPVKYYTEEKRTATKAEILGTAAPAGLQAFVQLLKQLQPDIVHFHEINGSNGITYFHIHAVYALGIKQFFTAHLPTLTCATSTLFYKNKVVCDGIIKIGKCSKCVIYNRTVNNTLANVASAISTTALQVQKKNTGRVAATQHFQHCIFNKQQTRTTGKSSKRA